MDHLEKILNNTIKKEIKIPSITPNNKTSENTCIANGISFYMIFKNVNIETNI